MNFPKPTGNAFSPEGASKAAEWHNWGLDDYYIRANAGGNIKWSPLELNRVAGEMHSQGIINGVEHAYIVQYVDRIGQHYNNVTNHWDRGALYVAGLVNDITGIHKAAASDPNASGEVFRTISNIALGSAVYWQDGGASGYDKDQLSMAALVIGDVVGAAGAAAWAWASGAKPGEIVGAAIVGGLMGSLMGLLAGALKVT